MSQTTTQKHKILIIDDDVLTREVFKAALSHSDFEAVSLESPALAETVVRQLKPDLILLDLYMPEINGLVLLRNLKKNPETAHIPVIILSGSDERDDVINGQKAGAYEYIVKPVDDKFLVDRIRSMLQVREQKGDAR